MRIKLYPKKEKPFYSVNYSLTNEIRSIETKISIRQHKSS